MEKKFRRNFSFFRKRIDNNEIISNINFINNFDKTEINYENIFKFRKIFLSVFGNGSFIESRKNNEILDIIDKYKNYNNNDDKYDMGYYNYTRYNISKALLDLLLNNNIDNSFIYKGNLIIKYLWDSFINVNQNISNININLNQKIIKKNNNIKKYDTNTYSGHLRYDKDEDVFFTDNINGNSSNKSKIIEKHIDLKRGSRRKKPNLNIYITNTFDINNNNNHIKDNFSKTMSTFFSSKNVLNNISKNNLGNKNKGIYLKKKCNLSSSNLINNNWSNRLNQTDINITRQFDIDKKEENNKINDGDINPNIKKNSFNKRNTLNILGKINISNDINSNTFNPQKKKDKNININLENPKEIITSKYIPEIRVRDLIYNKKKANNNIFNTENNINKSINSININMNKRKSFQPKQIETNKEINQNLNINTYEKEEDNKLNQTQLCNKLNETSVQEDSLNNSSILNATFNQSFSNNYYNLKKNIIISQKSKQTNSNLQFISNNNNEIKSTIFHQQNNNNNNTNQILSNNNSTPSKIQVKKNNYDTKYIINPDLLLCISLELYNDFCKICLLNQINHEIELFCFSQDQYEIPFIISFNEKNEIIIGQEAEQMNTYDPERTFFNLKSPIPNPHFNLFCINIYF